MKIKAYLVAGRIFDFFRRDKNPFKSGDRIRNIHNGRTGKIRTVISGALVTVSWDGGGCPDTARTASLEREE